MAASMPPPGGVPVPPPALQPYMMMPPPPPARTPLEELFDATQVGNADAVLALLEAQVVRPTDADHQGITALHWAAINNRQQIAELLIKRGANVNAPGGDLLATPIHWAARQGHLQMVALLVRCNADIRTVDRQGTSLMHIAGQFGQPFLLLYLRSLGCDVNARDANGRTPLMWAAYKSFSDDVPKLLVRFHADVNATDVSGCSALHWACHQGNHSSCETLLKAGANIDIKDAQGNTPSSILAQSKRPDALRELIAQMQARRPEVARQRNRLVYAVPFVALGLGFLALCHFNWLAGCLIFGMIGYGASLVVDRVCGKGVQFIYTPLLTAFYQASFFWCAVPYFGVILWATPDLVLVHVAFIALVAYTAYGCYHTVLGDAGVLPLPKDDDVALAEARALADRGKLDRRNFCTTCLIRRPLRSKHDRMLDRCVARYDHFCPWVYNAVGGGNHRIFVAFLSASVLTQLIYVFMAVTYASRVSSSQSFEAGPLCLLSSTACGYFAAAPMAMFTAIWCVLNGFWETGTLLSQYNQIASGLTVNESINAARYDYLQAEGRRRHGQSHDADAPAGRGVLRNCIAFWTTAPSANPFEIAQDDEKAP